MKVSFRTLKTFSSIYAIRWAISGEHRSFSEKLNFVIITKNSFHIMLICASLRQYAANLGICLSKPNEAKFNRKSVGVLYIFGQSFISVSAYLLFGAQTIREYEESFFVWITLSLVIVGFFSTVVRSPHLFKLLDTIEKMIENRK